MLRAVAKADAMLTLSSVL